MANIYYGINNGQNEYQVLVQGSPPASDVFLTVNDVTIPTREELLLAVEKLRNQILRSPYKPV